MLRILLLTLSFSTQALAFGPFSGWLDFLLHPERQGSAPSGACHACEAPAFHPVESLKNSMECQEVVVGACPFYQCTGKIADYPQQVRILLPTDALQASNAFQYHFHGHRFGNNYDLNLDKLVTNMELYKKACGPQAQTMIIPFSYGHCADFDAYFRSQENFNTFHHDVMKKMNLTQAPVLTLSAHSGGGRALGKIIKEGPTRIDQVEIYDGVYSWWQPDTIETWYKNTPQAKLKLIAVAPNGTDFDNYQTRSGASPFNLSKKVYNNLSGASSKQTFTQDNSTLYSLSSQEDGKSIEFGFEQASTCSHYTVLNHWLTH